MAESNFLSRIKEKWGITNNWDILIICFVFALTGMSAVQIRKVIFPFIGIHTETAFYIKFFAWLFVIFPFYYIFLLTYGFIFGKFNFFWNMTKKTFGRFGKIGRLFGKK
jgi:hypothetical protein